MVPMLRRSTVALVIVGIAAAVWLPARSLWVETGAPALERDETVEQLENPDQLWRRENMFVALQNLDRLGPYLPADQLPSNRYKNDARVRILALGDSTTWGDGLVDPGTRWPRRLERELNRRTADGAFEVVTVAAGGGSTFSQAGWLRAVMAGELDIVSGRGDASALQGPFDAVVVAFSMNDLIPWPESDPFLPDGVQVISEEGHNAVMEDPEGSPNWEAWREAVVDLHQAAEGIPVLWVPIRYPWSDLMPRSNSLSQIFEEAGYTIVGQAAVADLTGREPEESLLMANPANWHPGDRLHAAMAADVADAVLANVGSDRVARASVTPRPPRRSLVESHLPVALDVTVARDGAVRVVHADRPGVCPDDFGVWAYGWEASCVTGQKPRVLDGDRELAIQSVPCAELNAPHIQVMFDQYLVGSAAAVAVRVDAGDGLPRSVFQISYDEDGRRVFTPAGSVRSGETVELSFDSTYGVAVADEFGSCDLDAPVSAAPVTLTIAVK
jgi:lysophospholipase L1-like esterase